MSTNGTSSRQPSGSSTHSRGQSPSGSPNNIQTPRKLTPSAAGNAFGMGMNSGVGLKGLNSNWQMWGSSSPASKRNPSISSSTSVGDLPQTQGEGFRANLGDTWTAARSSSGTWEMPTPDMSSSPQRNDYSQLSPSHSLSLDQHSRQGRATAAQAAALAAPRIVGLTAEEERALSPIITLDQDERPSGLPKPASFSPQRFEGAGKDSTASRYGGAPSPVKPTGYGPPSPFSQTPSLTTPTGSYDHSQVQTTIDDLTLGVRGMVVEDDYSTTPQSSSYRPQGGNGSQAQGVNMQHPVPPMRGPPHMQQQQQSRPSYNAYNPPTDYTAYYPGTSGLDYTYGYDTYRNNPDLSLYGSPVPSNATPSTSGVYPGIPPQALHPHAHADMHRQQPGMFYDYTNSTRPPGSQYYYAPHQPMVYHPPAPPHSPMPSAQHVGGGPATITDKKREVQYVIQQQHQLNHQHNMLYASLRHSTPSPHPQAYAAALDYGQQMPLILPGAAMFGHPGHQAMALYQQGARPMHRLDGSDSGMTLRSPLLDEFRANKARKWELSDIFGYVVEFSGDQHGSRFIQQKLESATSEEKQIVFDEIVPDSALQLIQDVFGNYVIQKLFEHGTQVQKSLLASTMEGHVLPLSLQMYGCRVVQKAVEYVLPEQQAVFVKELDAHVLKCVKDANGNHVIQKLVERVSPERLGFVQSFRGNVYELSTHPYGCRVLQRCFEHLSEDQIRPLLDELHKYTVNLMQDQFGNYVIQFILERGQPQDRALIISKLRGQMLHMARHKFASNVCEKALITADPENRRHLIEEIMTPKQDGVSPIVTMMKDQFANYVLQRALTVVEGDQKEALIARIRPQLVTMRRYSSAYSKHLISIERLIEKSFGKTAEPSTAIVGSENTSEAERFSSSE